MGFNKKISNNINSDQSAKCFKSKFKKNIDNKELIVGSHPLHC